MAIVYAGWDRISSIHWADPSAGSFYFDVDTQQINSWSTPEVGPRSLDGYTGTTALVGDLIALPVTRFNPPNNAGEKQLSALEEWAGSDFGVETLQNRLTAYGLGVCSAPGHLSVFHMRCEKDNYTRWVDECRGPSQRYYHRSSGSQWCRVAERYGEWSVVDDPQRLVDDTVFEHATQLYYPVVAGAVGTEDPLAAQVDHWLENGLNLLDLATGEAGELPWAGDRRGTRSDNQWSVQTAILLQKYRYPRIVADHPRFSNFLPVALPVPVRTPWAKELAIQSLRMLSDSYRRRANGPEEGAETLPKSLIAEPSVSEIFSVPGVFGLFRVDSVETTTVSRRFDDDSLRPVPARTFDISTFRTTATPIGLVAAGLGWLETPRYAHFDAARPSWSPGFSDQPANDPIEVDPAQIRQALETMGPDSCVELPKSTWEDIADAVGESAQNGERESDDIRDALNEEGLVFESVVAGNGWQQRRAYRIAYNPVRAKRSQKARQARRTRKKGETPARPRKSDLSLFQASVWKSVMWDLYRRANDYLPAYQRGSFWTRVQASDSWASGFGIGDSRKTVQSLLVLLDVWAPDCWRTRPNLVTMVKEFHADPVRALRWCRDDADFSWELTYWFYRRHLDIQRGRLPADPLLPGNAWPEPSPASMVRSPRSYDLEERLWGYDREKLVERRQKFVELCNRLIAKEDAKKAKERAKEKARRKRERQKKRRKPARRVAPLVEA